MVMVGKVTISVAALAWDSLNVGAETNRRVSKANKAP